MRDCLKEHACKIELDCAAGAQPPRKRGVSLCVASVKCISLDCHASYKGRADRGKADEESPDLSSEFCLHLWRSSDISHRQNLACYGACFVCLSLLTSLEGRRLRITTRSALFFLSSFFPASVFILLSFVFFSFAVFFSSLSCFFSSFFCFLLLLLHPLTKTCHCWAFQRSGSHSLNDSACTHFAVH